MNFLSFRPRSLFVNDGAAAECCSLWVLLNNRNFPFSLPKNNIPESKVRLLNLWGASAVSYKIVPDLAA